jgi:nicotinamide riboside kinase
MWSHLHPVVRAGLYRRIAVLGAESTGTSTLSQDLSAALQAPLAAEAGRTVSWELYAAAGDMDQVDWQKGDFWSIIDQQIRFEHDAIWANVLKNSSWDPEIGPVLICDTDTLATVAWWERYLETDSAAPAGLASQRLADIYIVTSPEDVDFDSTDPTRDGQAIRLAMHDRFLDLVANCGQPWIEVRGAPEDRLNQALSFLNTVESEHPRFLHQLPIKRKDQS